jgi:hypothetical protein
MTRISRQKLWLPAILVALLVMVAWWGASASIGYESALRCCAFDPGTGGGLGLFHWGRQLGIPVQALQDPLWEAVATTSAREGNCFLTAGDGPWSPWGEELTQEQWTTIQHWIARGNALIVITTDPSALPKVFVDDLFRFDPNAVGPKTAPHEVSLFQPSVAASPETSTAALPGHRSLTIRADGPRWGKGLKGGESAADGTGVVWHRESVGKGAVYVLLDDFAWTNSGFDSAGNADALAALLARELRGGVFGFDEYRHGHGRVESFAVYLLRLPGANAFCLIAVSLAGIYLLGRNIRFGPPETFVLVERRSAREYVEAAAFLNQRARAAPLAVESIVRRLRAIALRRGRSNAEMEELLSQAERFAASGARPANPGEICGLARRLIAMRKKLYGS